VLPFLSARSLKFPQLRSGMSGQRGHLSYILTSAL